MKLTVLVDNNTYIDQYYYGEPGLSVYIENGEDRILFDTGYSHIFMENAALMGINLDRVSMVALSHGHNDHTRGMKYFFREPRRDVLLIAHPGCFYPKHYQGEEIGTPFSLEEMKEKSRLRLTKRPVEISEGLTFLGAVPRTMDFEPALAIGERERNGEREPDYLEEDTALVKKTPEGIYVITGCSHCGICNILEHAKEVAGEERVLGVIGGFHMFRTGERLEKTVEYLKNSRVGELYPCHCTNFKVKARIHETLPVHEVGVGFHAEW